MIRFFRFLRAQRRAADALLAAAVLIGLVIGLRLPSAILPEVTFPRVKVVAESGERPAQEMLRAVTRPLEEGLRLVPGVREMRSTTSRGSAEFNLDCAWGSNMDLTLQRVQARVDAVRGTLPDQTQVETRLMSPVVFPVIGFSLTSPTRSLAELRDLARVRWQPAMSRLPGVAQVIVQGGDPLEATVTLDPARLEGRHLDAPTVAEAIRRASDLHTVGLLEANRELYLSLADARPANLDALGEVPVPVDSGPPVPLGQLGKIALVPAPRFTRYAAHRHEAVLVNLLRQPAASTVALSKAAHRWIEQNRNTLPPDVKVETFYDQADLVRASVNSVRDSLLVGALMAIAIVAFFLGSLRLGLAAALVLPGSIALTLLGLGLGHQSLNLMTLGGIAAAVGLVLDDAIVVVEHFDHALAAGAGAEAVESAITEVFPSLLGSSLCTLAIFLPFMSLGGVTGAFFRVLALSMALMLTSSLLLCALVLPRVGRGARTEKKHGIRHAPAWTERALQFGPRHGWVGWAVPLVLLAAIPLLLLGVGTGFLPEMDEGSLILDYVAIPGTSLTETDRQLRHVEAILDSVPDIAAWSRRTGDQLGFFATEPNVGDYVLRLKSGRRRSSDQVADDLRGRINAAEPTLDIEFGQLVEDVIGDLIATPEPIEIRLFGEDRAVLQERARQAADLIEHVRGVVDVRNGVVVSGPNLEIQPASGAQRLGLSSDDLASQLEAYLQGIDAGEIQRGARSWPLRVYLPLPADASGVDVLRQARIPATAGHWVRVGDVATIAVQPGETEIERDDQREMVAVTGRLSGRDLGSGMREIQAKIAKNLPLAPGMTVEYGGLWREQKSSFQGLATVLLAATASVLLLLLISFRSWWEAGSVVVVAVASLVGVFAALLVTGVPFNVTSFVGAVMMVGIVAENAYFLVMEHRRGLAAGETAGEAATAAARRRARPVIMTTAAAVAALTPLALGIGSGSALLRPLAIAVIGGFMVSAFLLLLVLPSLLARQKAPTLS
ncbi:MAG TPA: efflux RND transporter permease subunit [Candidatus Eisenbacteria bacterium]|nr:efflux RND transporter permease subunit [Candidatus Eisenbacteria bacterium]